MSDYSKLKIFATTVGLLGWAILLYENWVIGIAVLLAMWGNNISQKL